jgi:23S rRNA (guanine1835-N2)-methyltransferase
MSKNNMSDNQTPDAEKNGALTQLHSPFGDFELQRRPATPNQPLQAWDAADDYLLAQFAQLHLAQATVLVINDLFGALAIALSAAGHRVYSWGDSSNAHFALAENCRRNNVDNNVTPLPATAALDAHPSLPKRFDAVLWRIPKSLALLQQQIAQLQPVVDHNTAIWVGGMIKHLPEQSVELLRPLGRVDILHAQKKARLFSVTPQTNLPTPPPPIDKLLTIADYELQLGGAANVFARDKFDIGARFFIEQLHKLPVGQRIADLGCGNGVLGLMAKRLQPGAAIYFFDESYQAVASAAENYRRNIDPALLPASHCYFDDCLSHYDGQPFDIILCNPPFHQSHATGDQIAWRMFTQSKNHLRSGGELWIVGNRHLQYHDKLKRMFGNCRQIAANPKFVVLAAQKK